MINFRLFHVDEITRKSYTEFLVLYFAVESTLRVKQV